MMGHTHPEPPGIPRGIRDLPPSLAYMWMDLWKAQGSSLFVSGDEVGCPQVSGMLLDTWVQATKCTLYLYLSYQELRELSAHGALMFIIHKLSVSAFRLNFINWVLPNTSVFQIEVGIGSIPLTLNSCHRFACHILREKTGKLSGSYTSLYK